MNLKIYGCSVLLLASMDTAAIDLKCDKVDLDADKNPIQSTYSENWTSFRNLKPDVNETYMDGDIRTVIQWSDSSVSIDKENTWFEKNGGGKYRSLYVINRKDFSWRGFHSNRKEGVISQGGTCSILEKPKDNAF